MQEKISEKVLVISMSVMVICLCAVNMVRNTRSKRQTSLEIAKKNFISAQSNNQHVFDSVYAKNDTVLFYRNDSFVGKIITVTE